MITNKELIEQLKKLPQDKCVFFTDICGNYECEIFEAKLVKDDWGTYIELVGEDYDI